MPVGPFTLRRIRITLPRDPSRSLFGLTALPPGFIQLHAAAIALQEDAGGLLGHRTRFRNELDNNIEAFMTN